jgi:O-acetyl-ADP-ribose deacetylase (regulator of RNase III)
MNKEIRQFVFASGKVLQINHGDITNEKIEAIVKAANAYLQHGGGVAGVISLNGGPQIQSESDQWIKRHGPVKHDSPAYTSGGKLACRYVIHAVGPVLGEGDEDRKLAEAIWGSLRLGDQLQIKSIAFPAISTGIFRFPKERAANIFFRQIMEYFEKFLLTNLEQVRLTLFDRESLSVFLKVADNIIHLHGTN